MKKIYFLVVSLLVFSASFSQSLTFEAFEGTFPPAGWMVVDSDGDTFEWIQSSWVGVGDTGLCATSASYDNNLGPLTPDNWLITPMVSVVAGDELAFWVQPQDPAWANENYAVIVSTTGSDLADFTDTLFKETITATDWTEHVLDISAYDGQDVYFAFRHYDCTDFFFLNLDNVEVRGSTPPPPTTVNVTFTVDCNSISDLDPAVDTFFIAGSFAGWTMPGDSLELALEDADADGVYSITLAIEPGDSVFYKYFRGPGWEGGEWGGDPNRAVYVAADTTITDWWGALAIESVIENDINIYPNPTNNILNITNIANANVRIFNIIGKEVVTINNASNFTTVDMSNLAEGTYIVKIIANSNIITRKISLIK